jgi:hypothetical protein
VKVGLHQRPAHDLDAVVEARDREVVRDVLVPVEIAVHAGRRPDRQHEGRQRLVGGGLGLHPELERGLADERVVRERQPLLDLQEHPR